ncbi:ERAD-associated E3 ubiquitin-protein ligase hrd1 [Pichia kudriavzevii]|uniref:ERAD-associated E3 ubiquitin-protein ligase hrd1 n=1 Tax=Pichia kudriavzevii TaxID=4909 RepID=A0A1V2LN79_PICKU|nr:ERAD-associated E3 ubiquitin-protein ligase hrd1 [Pichia kudriavzevii]
MDNGRQRFGLLGYILASTLIAIHKLAALYDESPNFYVLGAKVSHGDAVIIFGNLLVSMFFGAGILLQNLVFGELRLIEVEHLYERLWPTIISLVVSANIYKSSENSFLLIISSLGLVTSKVFHCIVVDRLDFLIQQHYQRNDQKIWKILVNRVILLLIALLRMDIFMIVSCIDESFIHKSPLLLVLSFEFFLLCIDLSYATVKFSLDVFELYYLQKYPEEEVWAWKKWIDSITKVIISLIKTIMIPTLLFFFAMLESFPFNLFGELFTTILQLFKSVSNLFRLIKSAKRLNDCLGYPTEEEKDVIPGKDSERGGRRNQQEAEQIELQARVEGPEREEQVPQVEEAAEEPLGGHVDHVVTPAVPTPTMPPSPSPPTVPAEEEEYSRYFEGVPMEAPTTVDRYGDTYTGTVGNSSGISNKLGQVMSRIGGLELNDGQRRQFEHAQALLEGEGEGVVDDEECDFVHELPPGSEVPGDWTIFPVEKGSKEDEFRVRVGRSTRLRVRRVRNGRLVDEETFNKYTR